MTSFLQPLKASNRGRSEQIVGLGIYLALSAALLLLNGEIGENIWLFTGSTLFYLAAAVGGWTLWRRYPLRSLRFEMVLYFGQFPLQVLWVFSFFAWGALPALMLGILQTMATLLTAIVFWKKERLAGIWMVAPLTVALGAVCVNLGVCLCY